MGKPVEEFGDAWMRAIANPIPPVAFKAPRCQEVVLTGAKLEDAGGCCGARPVSTPGFDSAPISPPALCITRDPETGIQNMGTYRAALKGSDRLVVRMVAREASGAGLFTLAQIPQRGEHMPIAIVIGLRTRRDVHRSAEARPSIWMSSRGRRARRRSDRDCESAHSQPRSAAGSEIVIEGLIDPDRLEPEAPFGESNGYVALEAYNMPCG